MELKVGMYVRYTRGAINGYVPPRIAKIVDCSDNELVRIDSWQVILRNDVIKARDNLIDLIEVGDYVNGGKVTEEMIKMRDEQGVFGLPDKNKVFIDEIKIKNIVTKEMFDSVKYEVE